LVTSSLFYLLLGNWHFIWYSWCSSCKTMALATAVPFPVRIYISSWTYPSRYCNLSSMPHISVTKSITQHILLFQARCNQNVSGYANVKLHQFHLPILIRYELWFGSLAVVTSVLEDPHNLNQNASCEKDTMNIKMASDFWRIIFVL